MTPTPGWYADPADGGRHRYWDGNAWTGKTRSAGVSTLSVEDSPKQRRTGLWLGLGLLAIAGIGAAVAFLLDSYDTEPGAKPGSTPDVAESAPTPISTTDPSEVIVPEGWSL
ncbi:MAG: DUF2510 domain-containing protein [Demequinaceae bacterium]|nr:DUF2510 domain-containing protein [Demequinaceae bacterium]